MKLISHRGNLFGQDELTENTPDAIEIAIQKYGLDVEIDVWIHEDGEIYLGHDYGKYKISIDFLFRHADKLWIHCKNLKALSYLSLLLPLNVFWHEEDTYTLTSKGYIWAYPGVETNHQTIIVLPNFKDAEKFKIKPFGVCTDNPLHYLMVNAREKDIS